MRTAINNFSHDCQPRLVEQKSVKDKYNEVKGFEQGQAKSQVACKYGKPYYTLQTWIKNAKPWNEETTLHGKATEIMQIFIAEILSGFNTTKRWILPQIFWKWDKRVW